ncbi:MAG: hypothetical protein LBV69_08840 [Bacteroidales bacterium]|jgi:hypothetical protein|nr:hypothetical protein [Bacteroidales bacterium]
MPKNIVIEDILGYYKTFNSLLEKLDLQPCDNIYLLGDMISKRLSISKILNYIIFFT